MVAVSAPIDGGLSRGAGGTRIASNLRYGAVSRATEHNIDDHGKTAGMHHQRRIGVLTSAADCPGLYAVNQGVVQVSHE
ncbi:MAG: hypothetical protein RIK87_00955 [Fuerstiella sp.]